MHCTGRAERCRLHRRRVVRVSKGVVDGSQSRDSEWELHWPVRCALFMHNFHSCDPAPGLLHLPGKTRYLRWKCSWWATCLACRQDSCLVARLLGRIHGPCTLTRVAPYTGEAEEATVISSAERQQQPQNLKTISSTQALKPTLKDNRPKLQNYRKTNCQEAVITAFWLPGESSFSNFIPMQSCRE